MEKINSKLKLRCQLATHHLQMSLLKVTLRQSVAFLWHCKGFPRFKTPEYRPPLNKNYNI